MPDTFLLRCKIYTTYDDQHLFSTFFSLALLFILISVLRIISVRRVVYIPLFFARAFDYAIAILRAISLSIRIYSVFCALIALCSVVVLVVAIINSVSQHINYYNNLYLSFFLRFVQFFLWPLRVKTPYHPPLSLSKTIVFKLFSTLLLLLLL